MDLQFLFQWHKLLHIILPIIIIATLHKQLGLLRTCVIVFIAGFLKEIHDIIIIMDPLLESIIDLGLDVVGIILGIIWII